MTEQDNPHQPLSHQEINDLRLRIVRGEEPSVDEMAALVQTLIARRIDLAPKEKPKAKPKAAPKIDLDQFL